MIRVLNSMGISALVFVIYNCVSLFSPVVETKKDEIRIERKMEVKENKKIEVPPPSPKSFNSKLISKYEMIDALDSAITEHIIKVLEINRYGCMGKDRTRYAQELSAALLKHTDGNINLLLWITAMARVESSYRLNADPRVSSARGYLQVIYKYHEKELKKLGISKDDICTDPYKSVLAGVTVFKKYLKIEHGNFERATRRYRGLSVTEQQQKYYLNSIIAEKARIEKIIAQYA